MSPDAGRPAQQANRAGRTDRRDSDTARVAEPADSRLLRIIRKRVAELDIEIYTYGLEDDEREDLEECIAAIRDLLSHIERKLGGGR